MMPITQLKKQTTAQTTGCQPHGARPVSLPEADRLTVCREREQYGKDYDTRIHGFPFVGCRGYRQHAAGA